MPAKEATSSPACTSLTLTACTEQYKGKKQMIKYQLTCYKTKTYNVQKQALIALEA